MQHSIRRFFGFLVACCVSLAALAQDFPSRPVTLIVPWLPGGSTDLHLRKFAEIGGRYLGQPIIVENRAGGGGMLGPGNMARIAKPDGYTIAQLPMGAFRIPHMQVVEWDPLRDFTYIIGVTGYTFGIVVKSDSPFKTFRDVIEYAKANPGKMSYASTGIGTSPHLLMEEVGIKTGVDFLHVPFKANADATQALMGGHVMAQSDATGWAKFVDSGANRLLVTFGNVRTKRWPSVPTAKELGMGVVSTSPYGTVGPRGINGGVVKVMHDAFRKTIEDPEHMKMLDQLDQEPWYQSSEDYAKYARETFRGERVLIERLGLLSK